MPHVRATRHVSKDGSNVVERKALTKSLLIGEIISGIFVFEITTDASNSHRRRDWAFE